ncbi:TRAP transporter small permease [Nitrincola tapanii]|uniref:TRAP transporter small permease protein n=1 Tax=Nitrincola tapanii TaxID=1708751 RepID=A0A5A9W839_9GAMM|nr:TRAP transporter small permease subunit [Nitrincola tapanii]KAA0875631.1 TRAP transporter small permease subunit [Nitrincola tapanii]
MSFLAKLVEKVTLALMLVGVLAVVAMMLHITLDVMLRTTLNYSVPATERIVTRYYMVALALLPLGWVEWSKNMITVEAFTQLYGKYGFLILSLLTSLLSAVIYYLLGVATWGQAIEQFNLGSYIMSLNLVIPIWPAYFFVPVALFVAMFVCLARIPLMLTNRY